MGLSFSVQPHVRPVPRSLQNIFAELADDVGAPTPANGDLSAWSDQGVMLLNRVLTVRPGEPGSHRGQGWEAVTEAAIRALVARDAPLVAILWGRDAATLRPMLGDTPSSRAPTEPALRASRVLRVAPVLPRQRAPRRPGRRPRRLDPPHHLTPARSPPPPPSRRSWLVRVA